MMVRFFGLKKFLSKRIGFCYLSWCRWMVLFRLSRLKLLVWCRFLYVCLMLWLYVLVLMIVYMCELGVWWWVIWRLLVSVGLWMMVWMGFGMMVNL